MYLISQLLAQLEMVQRQFCPICVSANLGISQEAAASPLRPHSVSLFSLPWDQTSCWRGVSLVTTMREEKHGSLGLATGRASPLCQRSAAPGGERWARTCLSPHSRAGATCSQVACWPILSGMTFFSGMAVAIKNKKTPRKHQRTEV